MILRKSTYLFVRWNSDIAAATEAFKLEVLPLRGILSRKSHFFWVSKEIPLSSAPTTTTKGFFSWKLDIDKLLYPDSPIIRSAEAFDCKGIIIPQRRSAGLTGTVAKVAAGALEHLPVSRVVNLNRALEELKKNGFIVVGLSGDGQTSISMFNEKTPLVVIVGSEDKGISVLTQKKCDFLLRIPLKGKTSSLNASVAAAISLFHLTS